MYNINVTIQEMRFFRYKIISAVWRTDKFEPEVSLQRTLFQKRRALRYARLMGMALDFAYNKGDENENQ